MVSSPQPPIRLNADPDAFVLMQSADAVWTASPEPGVERRMLDRIGGEIARATSIVRYAPGSRFAAHDHAQGEEFLVLDGVFSDAQGDYPAGTYVRNPPGSQHAPYSDGGCTIFVKLRHMTPAQTSPVCVDSRGMLWNAIEGGAMLQLFEDDREHVRLQRLSTGRSLAPSSAAQFELLVVAGSGEVAGTPLSQGDWLRAPGGCVPTIVATTDFELLIKTSC